MPRLTLYDQQLNGQLEAPPKSSSDDLAGRLVASESITTIASLMRWCGLVAKVIEDLAIRYRQVFRLEIRHRADVPITRPMALKRRSPYFPCNRASLRDRVARWDSADKT